eukprot:975566-Ditylum_brightwellii.AAC.1
MGRGRKSIANTMAVVTMIPTRAIMILPSGSIAIVMYALTESRVSNKSTLLRMLHGMPQNKGQIPKMEDINTFVGKKVDDILKMCNKDLLAISWWLGQL